MWLNKFSLGLVVSGLVSVVGCSVATESLDQVAQERVFQTYTVVFDQASDKTQAEAEFRFGDATGTTLRLAGSSAATDSACPLNEQNLFGTHYSGEATGFVPEHVFKFVDAKGKAYSNKVAIVPIDFKADTPAEFSRAADYTLIWDGAPVAANETVTVLVQDQNQVSISTAVALPDAVNVVIPATEWAKLTNGAITIQLSRVATKALEQATDRGGNIFATFKTKPRAATLKD